jgi:hypothetical protein
MKLKLKRSIIDSIIAPAEADARVMPMLGTKSSSGGLEFPREREWRRCKGLFQMLHQMQTMQLMQIVTFVTAKM